MTVITEAAVLDALRTVQEPEGRKIVAINNVKRIDRPGNRKRAKP